MNPRPEWVVTVRMTGTSTLLPADRGGHFAVLATGVGAWI